MMLAEAFFSCTALLASRLDIPWVNYFPATPLEPYLTAVWAGSPRRAFVPNPLSYFPQTSMSTTTQFMVCSFQSSMPYLTCGSDASATCIAGI